MRDRRMTNVIPSTAVRFARKYGEPVNVTGTLTGARTDENVVFTFERISDTLVSVRVAISNDTTVAADKITWTPDTSAEISQFLPDADDWAITAGRDNEAAAIISVKFITATPVIMFGVGGHDIEGSEGLPPDFTDAKECTVPPSLLFFKSSIK